MSPAWLAAAFLLSTTSWYTVHSMRITGEWTTSKGQFTVIAKFGFQQTDLLDREHTWGFIFGNITSSRSEQGRATLVLVPQTMISSFVSDSLYGKTCDSMLQGVSAMAFETRCFPKGKSDIIRWIPCPTGKLCEEEDDPKKLLTSKGLQVVKGYQMTLHVEEPYGPQYWYVAIASCTLDRSCNWTSSSGEMQLKYDIWLTNGSPLAEHFDLLAYQFSFDEQDSVGIYFLSFGAYLILSLFEWRAVTQRKEGQISGKQKLLCAVLATKTLGLFLQSLNVIVFAYDGRGLVVARFLGEFFRLSAVCVLYLLLILLSRGWSINDCYGTAANQPTVITWGVLVALHFFFFFANFFFVVDILHDIDVFKSWPGYSMLLVRMGQALWFLTEIRYTIGRERDEEKAVFLAYFGAGFLVWFVYLSALGVIVSFMSVLWRFKVILAITTIANFVAICSLVHLFWPTGFYSRFFAAGTRYTSAHRRLDSVDSAEMKDIELLLQDSDSDSEVPVSLNLHDI